MTVRNDAKRNAKAVEASQSEARARILEDRDEAQYERTQADLAKKDARIAELEQDRDRWAVWARAWNQKAHQLRHHVANLLTLVQGCLDRGRLIVPPDKSPPVLPEMPPELPDLQDLPKVIFDYDPKGKPKQ